MSAAAAPRLTLGVFASVLLHGAVVAAFVFFLHPTPMPAPPLYQVKIFAAPPGDRAIGVVQSEPTPAPAPATTPAPPVATKAVAPAKPKPSAPVVAKPKPTAKAKTPAAATPVAPRASTPSKADAPAPKAGGGATGGKGADVATVNTPGIEFPYPYYTNNIVRQLLLQFGQSNENFTAEVRFVIRRDGSVDPESIKLVTPSASYPFNQRALAAVDAAARSKAFGPLPPGFGEDILPVNFRFSPQIR